jgi:hypothetical protein
LETECRTKVTFARPAFLAVAERDDDEHLVPSAIRYYVSPWCVLSSRGQLGEIRRRPT